MKIKIHRGANQIGGCITEIATDGCRVFIDLGCNLPGNYRDEMTVEEVERLTSGADAVFYTHYHSDHLGLNCFVPDWVPQYMGAGARDVVMCRYKTQASRQKELNRIEKFMTYEANRTIDVGGKGKIFVTPYIVSHSAFDSYMLKIECEGKTILHTGDFRKHGYLGKGLFPTLRKFVGQVDIVITEGTMLGRMSEKVVTENDIRLTVGKFLCSHKYVFALCSSTDIDRLAGLKEACKGSRRNFVVIRYQKNILDVFTEHARKYNAKNNRDNRLYCFDNAFVLTDIRSRNVFEKLRNEGFLMVINPQMYNLVKKMVSVFLEEPSWLVYSLWQGYTEEWKSYSDPKIIKLRELFGNNILDGVKDGVHTSGHADMNTLAEACEILNPRIGVIPIHKDSCRSDVLASVFGEHRIITEAKTVIGNIVVELF